MKKMFKMLSCIMILYVMIYCGNVAAETSVNKSDEAISANYAWAPYFYPYSTVEIFGTSSTNKISKDTTTSIYGGEFYRLDLSSRDNVQKNTSGVILKNIGQYNGQTVDMKITYVNWKYKDNCTSDSTHSDEAGIEVYPNPRPTTDGATVEDALKNKGHIHLSRSGCVQEMEYKIDFINHDTKQPIKIGGHFNLFDVDVYDDNIVEYIYDTFGASELRASSNSKCDRHEPSLIGAGITCNEKNNPSGSMNANKDYILNLLYDTTSVGLVYGMHSPGPGETSGGGFAGGATAAKIEYPAPVKTISKLNKIRTFDTINVNQEEDFNFYIEQMIPRQGSEENKLTSLKYIDTIDNDLDVVSCHIVTTPNSSDYSLDSYFNINCDNDIVAEWNGKGLSELVEKNIMLQVTAKIKSGNLTNSKNFSNGLLTVPNKGNVIINGKNNSTNVVKVATKIEPKNVVIVPNTLANLPFIVKVAAIMLLLFAVIILSKILIEKKSNKNDKKTE